MRIPYFGCSYWIRLSCTYSPKLKKQQSLSPINDELNTNPIDNIRTKCLLKQHTTTTFVPVWRTLITSNPNDVRFNSLFLFTQINSSLLEGEQGYPNQGRTKDEQVTNQRRTRDEPGTNQGRTRDEPGTS